MYATCGIGQVFFMLISKNNKMLQIKQPSIGFADQLTALVNVV